MISVALVGFGYWGPNLFRVFSSHLSFDVKTVVDLDENKLKLVKKRHPNVKFSQDLKDVIDDKDIDAVVIATPVNSHYSIALKALNAGKHVLVEKPLCSNSEQVEELVAVAKQKNLILMVDHPFLFTGAMQKIKEIIAKNDLGTLFSYDSTRVSLGLFREDANVLWDLAPHDFSIINYLFNEKPLHIEASGFAHVNPELPDITSLTLYFASHKTAHIYLSWMSPVKIRRIAIGGDKKMLIWDDLDRDQKIRVYDSGITFQPSESREIIIPDYRIGDIHSPKISNQEALYAVATHFEQVIKGKEKSIMDGNEGLKVLRMLEQAQSSLDESLLKSRKLREQYKKEVEYV